MLKIRFFNSEDHSIAIFDIAKDGTLIENAVKKEVSDFQGSITALDATEDDEKMCCFVASGEGTVSNFFFFCSSFSY